MCLCVLLWAVLIAFWIGALTLRAPWEYAEGDCATWIWMVRHGESLYRSSGAVMRASNYPPLYLWLAAALAPSDAAILFSGRLVSLAGFALALALVFVCALRATDSWRAGAVAAALCGGAAWLGLWGTICRPDALALGVGAAGVTCAALRLRGWPLAAALCFSLSLLTKQSLIILPAGTIGWALVNDRRNGIVCCLLTAAIVGTTLTLGGLWIPLIAHSAAGFRPSRFLENLLHYLLPMAFGLVLAVDLIRRWPTLPERARRVCGPWIYVLAAALPWTLSLGRIGASYNYVFELSLAVSVLATVAVADAPHLAGRTRLLAGHAALLLALTGFDAARLLTTTMPRMRAEAVAARAALAGVTGPVLSEQSFWALYSGHAAVVVPFLAAQLSLAGSWDAAPLVLALRRGQVERVLLEFDLEDQGATVEADHGDRFTPALLAAVRDRYQLERVQGALHVYRPR